MFFNLLKSRVLPDSQSTPQTNNNNTQNEDDLSLWEDLSNDPTIMELLDAANDWHDLYNDQTTITLLITTLVDKRKKYEMARKNGINTAKNTLEKAQGLLPADLQGFITTDVNDDNSIEMLERARQICSSYMPRADANFAQTYISETIEKNFQKCENFNHLNVFTYLGYADDTVGIAASYDDVVKRLTEKRTAATTPRNESELWRVRQVEYLFGDPIAQATFNAFMKGDKNALETLQIDASSLEPLSTSRSDISLVKAELINIDKQLKAFDTKITALDTHLQTLQS